VVLRPRDAAAILVVDRSAGGQRVLMGRRASAHVFMPDVYVFPGGRRDAGDHRQAYTRDLHPDTLAKLRVAAPRRMGPAGARALALAAVRELSEETGLIFGVNGAQASDRLPAPSLSSLRFVARAETPPGYARRYDTRFFLTFTDEAGIDPTAISDSAELLDLQWVDMNAVSCLNMPDITKTILAGVIDRMKADPPLGFAGDVPFYLQRRGRFVRQML
jgi:8-oxo-dGTP pyrophosphatase MutT (NUDIX family)